MRTSSGVDAERPWPVLFFTVLPLLEELWQPTVSLRPPGRLGRSFDTSVACGVCLRSFLWLRRGRSGQLPVPVRLLGCSMTHTDSIQQTDEIACSEAAIAAPR
jgi:hypothetical protein